MSLNIKLDDSFRIINDSYNIVLVEKVKVTNKPPKGEIKNEFTERKRYFPSVAMALKSYVTVSVLADDVLVSTVDEYVKKINEAYNRISGLLKNESVL
ncbi:hypothetical protein [Liquorilactobacillus nagelii]|uniref:hypothetical protein n=1 Tax=Liquorilactobacillus nagelii TaxID=82688 RepID=UPI0039E82CA4